MSAARVRKHRAKKALERATRRAFDHGLDVRAVVNDCLHQLRLELAAELRAEREGAVTGQGK